MVCAVNMKGKRKAVSHPVPSGPWTLAGDIFIGPTSRKKPWSASVELLATDGRVLRVQLDYENQGGSGTATSSTFWYRPDGSEPASGASQMSQQEADMPTDLGFRVKAKTSFRIAYDDERKTVTVYVDGHGTRSLTPTGSTPIFGASGVFEAVRLVSDAGQGRWQSLAFERPD